jgi:ABC-type branched-subunit amino acid transport system ATPase component
MSTTVLETRNLTKQFGGLTATNNVSLQLEAGARHALIGPNGAGKTTFVNLLTGVLTPTSGTILLEGADITNAKPEARVRRGLARTFQINQLFKDLTVFETLGIAVNEQRGIGARLFGSFSRDATTRQTVEGLAHEFGLSSLLNTRTSDLAYGRQRLLELGVAFACKPRVLLLDEPAAGVPEAERHDLLATIARLPRDVAILLIEHDMDLVFSFAEHITVLVEGALLTTGTPDEIAHDPRVKAVYLGEGDTHG